MDIANIADKQPASSEFSLAFLNDKHQEMNATFLQMPTIDGVCLSVFRTLVTPVKQSVALCHFTFLQINLVFCSSSTSMKVLMLNIELICRK